MVNRKFLMTALLGAVVFAFGSSVSFPVYAHPADDDTGTASRRPPRTYDVEHYIIRTRFDRSTRTVFGDVSIRMHALNEPIKSFDLDASGLRIESVKLESDGSDLEWKTSPNHLTIHLPMPCDPATSFTVRIVYSAQPRRGLYFIPGVKGAPGEAQPAQIWSQGEAEDNHYWFPGYDFPDDKATAEQYITTTQPNEIAISNGTLVGVAPGPHGTHIYHWSMDQPFSSYLISLVVGDYSQIKTKYGDIAVEYNTYPGTDEVARRVFAKTPRMIQWFAKVLNYPFPYQRYAQTIVANFSFAGMENITATTHADTEILYEAPDEPADASDDLVSHELSHSWFGDLVTCRDWSELWLNEGLATFMEASFKESEKGREGYLSELAEDQREYFSEDTPAHRHPLVNKNYTTGSELFDLTTYKKGGWVIHMLRQTVGDEVFWRALNVYLNKYKYDNVTSADLEHVFEQVSGQNLDWFFKQWVYQAGYPELIVRYGYNADKGQLTVEVNQTQKATADTPAAFRFPLEIKVTTAQGPQMVSADVTQRSQVFTFDLTDFPKDVEFDPNSRVLKKLEVKKMVMTKAA